MRWPLTTLLTLLVTLPPTAAAWDGAGGDPCGTRNAEGTFGSSPSLAWTADADDIWAPIVMDDVLVVAETTGRVRAFSLDGALLWEHMMPGDDKPRGTWGNVVQAAPVFHEGAVIVATRDGIVQALRRDSGFVAWELLLEQNVFASPVVTGGTLYMAADRWVYAIDASTGHPLWRTEVDDWVDRGLSLDHERLYVPFGDTLVALDRFDGSKQWRTPASGSRPQGVAVHDGEVALVNGGQLEIRDATTGAMTASLQLGTRFDAFALPWQSGWVVATHEGIDLWTSAGLKHHDGRVVAAPLVAGAQLVVPTPDAILLLGRGLQDFGSLSAPTGHLVSIAAHEGLIVVQDYSGFQVWSAPGDLASFPECAAQSSRIVEDHGVKPGVLPTYEEPGFNNPTWDWFRFTILPPTLIILGMAAVLGAPLYLGLKRRPWAEAARLVVTWVAGVAALYLAGMLKSLWGDAYEFSLWDIIPWVLALLGLAAVGAWGAYQAYRAEGRHAWITAGVVGGLFLAAYWTLPPTSPGQDLGLGALALVIALALIGLAWTITVGTLSWLGVRWERVRAWWPATGGVVLGLAGATVLWGAYALATVS